MESPCDAQAQARERTEREADRDARREGAGRDEPESHDVLLRRGPLLPAYSLGAVNTVA